MMKQTVGHILKRKAKIGAGTAVACSGLPRLPAGRAPVRILASAVFVWISLAGVLPAAETVSTSEHFFDVTDMKTIRTYVEDVPGSREKRVTAIAMVEAPIARVWRVLVDYDRLGRSISLVKLNQIAFLEEQNTQVDLTLDLPWPMKDIYCPLVFTENPSKGFLKWRNSGGCSGTVRGDITLRGEGNATRLKFSISMNPDKAVPQWLINWGFKQNLPREIESIRLLVKQQEGGASEQRSLPTDIQRGPTRLYTPGTSAAR